MTVSAMLNKSKRPGSGRCADMMDDLKNTTTTEAVAEDWAKVKLPPCVTGLPMAVSALFMAIAVPGAPLHR